MGWLATKPKGPTGSSSAAGVPSRKVGTQELVGHKGLCLGVSMSQPHASLCRRGRHLQAKKLGAHPGHLQHLLTPPRHPGPRHGAIKCHSSMSLCVCVCPWEKSQLTSLLSPFLLNSTSSAPLLLFPSAAHKHSLTQTPQGQFPRTSTKPFPSSHGLVPLATFLCFSSTYPDHHTASHGINQMQLSPSDYYNPN